MAQTGESKSIQNVRGQFERRRILYAIVLLLVPAVFCGLMLKGCENPTKPAFGQGLAEPTRSVPAVVVAATSTPVVFNSMPVVRPTDGGLNCRAMKDIDIGGRRVPALSIVRVDGYSPSLGGVFLVGGSYQSVLDVRCDFSVPEIAVSLMLPTMTPTSVVKASLGSGGVAPTRIVIVTATPGLSIPTVSPTPVNGLSWDGDCILLNLDGIKRVYVDGKPATGHQRICGMNELQIFFR